ncbi:MAG: hypothetical protein FD156_1336 [Nitrospirae bacterium]|nr:MAG: hypothetical protein FD156_1336 [Nitrospirota bacterium]
MRQRDINKIQAIIFLRRLIAYLLVICLLLLIPSLSFASDGNYIYDDTGRLIKTISETGEVATYNYDGVGNLISITTHTISQNPPALNSINPDIVFLNSTIDVTITGANLFTTQSITSDNAGISISNISATDSTITASLTISWGAPLGQANINVTTFYGSASIPIIVYKLILEPGAAYLLTGETVTISAGITPSASRDLNLAIINETPDVIEASQSIIIPSGGNGTFTVRALSQGTGIVAVGGVIGTVFVTPPLSGDVATSGAPVSVYMESSTVDAATISAPVSAYMELALSVDAVESGPPVSVYKEEPLSMDAVESGPPVSVYKEEPLSMDATTISAPVSAEISPQ